MYPSHCIDEEFLIRSFANRSFQSRPKATATRRCNLVNLTRPNREKLSHPRKVNVGPFPPATQQNWLANLKVKEVVSTTLSQAPTPSHTIERPVQSPTSPVPPEHTKYCAICTPLERYVLINSLYLQTGMKILKKKREKIRVKKKIKKIVKGGYPKSVPDSYWLPSSLLSLQILHWAVQQKVQCDTWKWRTKMQYY